ncbi:MAG: YfcE family phosphodiesterase [Anaerolineales bacterium]|nr:YfcE family phosphodiesterase [Anaerolineales bacterium]
MRVILLADIHANWEALLALQRAEQQPDAVLFAGDAVGYGPEPAQCVRWLRGNSQAAVQGNHDYALTQATGGAPPGLPAELAEAAQQTLEMARRRLALADLAALAAWPLTATVEIGGARFHLCHATPVDPLGGEFSPALACEAALENLYSGVAADVLVVGHTHLPALRQWGRRVVVNPGSLGQPRHGVPDATYAVWDDGRLQIRHLHYDHAGAALRLSLCGLGVEITEQLTAALATGLLTTYLP